LPPDCSRKFPNSRSQRSPDLRRFFEPTAQVLGDILQKYAVDPYQQFAYTKGKNASDIALVIDAMDLLHSGRFDVFALFLPTAILPASPHDCGSRERTSTASAIRERRKAFGRPVAGSFIRKI
jgi:hypothetical protein